ncbi:hypothetical protein A6X21_17440 [Planctopirus hydrillae]|uniref:Uncharacterized protein n=1 Tax=Planctopirus hydrillae TaxID=1841610 RepID=A0A1C3EMJ0_9PLAN|nr:hypothetical protein A6X21_17440 [Planctopirus hydrillae]
MISTPNLQTFSVDHSPQSCTIVPPGTTSLDAHRFLAVESTPQPLPYDKRSNSIQRSLLFEEIALHGTHSR